MLRQIIPLLLCSLMQATTVTVTVSEFFQLLLPPIVIQTTSCSAVCLYLHHFPHHIGNTEIPLELPISRKLRFKDKKESIDLVN